MMNMFLEIGRARSLSFTDQECAFAFHPCPTIHALAEGRVSSRFNTGRADHEHLQCEMILPQPTVSAVSGRSVSPLASGFSDRVASGIVRNVRKRAVGECLSNTIFHNVSPTSFLITGGEDEVEFRSENDSAVDRIGALKPVLRHLFLFTFSILAWGLAAISRASLSINRCFNVKCILVLISLFLCGCSHSGRLAREALSQDYGPGTTERLSTRDGSILGRSEANETTLETIQGDQSVRSSGPQRVSLDEGFRVSFTGIAADQLLRVLSDHTNIQYVGNSDELAGPVLAIDVNVLTTDDVFMIADVIAESIGKRAVWDGPRLSFTSEEGLSVHRGGYLIRSGKMSAVLQTLILTRYDVECTAETRITVCIGDNAALDRAQTLIRDYTSLTADLDVVYLETSIDVSAIVEAYGLGEFVTVSRVGSGVLVASSRRDLVTLITRAVDRIDNNEICSDLIVEVSEGVDALSLIDEAWTCGAGSLQKGVLIAPIFEAYHERVRARLALIDRPSPVVRLQMVFVTAANAEQAGFSLRSFTPSIPVEEWPDFLDLAASLDRSQLLATAEVATTGRSTVSVTRTDRLDGDLLVTDGGTTVQGIENRTTGLTLSVSGSVTHRGYSGELSIENSSANGDTTSSTACDTSLSVSVGSVARVCRFQSETGSRGLSLSQGGIEAGSNDIVVFVVVLAHETYDLERFSAWVGAQ